MPLKRIITLKTTGIYYVNDLIVIQWFFKEIDNVFIIIYQLQMDLPKHKVNKKFLPVSQLAPM